MGRESQIEVSSEGIKSMEEYPRERDRENRRIIHSLETGTIRMPYSGKLSWRELIQ